MHEWAAGATTINPHFGATANPWDTTRIPGGSSGGSAAAVAAALCAGSLGSDTAGSIRMPSSLCGTVGLKPTYGLASLRGVLPLSWSLDHVGPMTRTVEDAALLMEAIAGYDPQDPSSVDRPGADYRDALRGDVRGLRLGLPRNYFFDGADPEVVAAVRRAASLLEAEGAHVTEVEVPGVEQAFAVGMPVLVAEAAAYHEKYLQERPGDYGEDVLALLRAGQSQTAIDYIRAQRARIEFRQGLEALFTRIDALLTPTTPITAPTIEQCRAGAAHPRPYPLHLSLQRGRSAGAISALRALGGGPAHRAPDRGASLRGGDGAARGRCLRAGQRLERAPPADGLAARSPCHCSENAAS